MKGMLIRFEKTVGQFLRKLINVPADNEKNLTIFNHQKWSTYFRVRQLHNLKKHLFILKVIAVAILTSMGQHSFAQTDTIEKNNQPVYIYFYFLGLGSNVGMFEPTFKLTQTKFSYTKEQNSGYGNASKKVRRISSGTFRQSSIDSIIYLVRLMKDSTVFKSNPCVHSGGIYYLTVANGTDTTKFELMNTLDYTALKIIKIINEYLPSKKQIWASEKLIKDEEDCLTDLRKKANNYKQ